MPTKGKTVTVEHGPNGEKMTIVENDERDMYAWRKEFNIEATDDNDRGEPLGFLRVVVFDNKNKETDKQDQIVLTDLIGSDGFFSGMVSVLVNNDKLFAYMKRIVRAAELHRKISGGNIVEMLDELMRRDERRDPWAALVDMIENKGRRARFEPGGIMHTEGREPLFTNAEVEEIIGRMTGAKPERVDGIDKQKPTDGKAAVKDSPPAPDAPK